MCHFSSGVKKLKHACNTCIGFLHRGTNLGTEADMIFNDGRGLFEMIRFQKGFHLIEISGLVFACPEVLH
jgi:hypothetical protein